MRTALIIILIVFMGHFHVQFTNFGKILALLSIGIAGFEDVLTLRSLIDKNDSN